MAMIKSQASAAVMMEMKLMAGSANTMETTATTKMTTPKVRTFARLMPSRPKKPAMSTDCGGDDAGEIQSQKRLESGNGCHNAPNDVDNADDDSGQAAGNRFHN